MQVDRRVFSRADYEAPVQCVADGTLVSGNIIDISEGGARLRTRAKLPAVNVIKLFVPLPGERESKRLCLVEGRRIWVNEDQIGIEFIDPPTDTLLDIARAMAVA